MRTSPIVKRLESGETRRVVEVFIASELIVAGDLVSLDLSATPDGDMGLYVAKADSAADNVPVGFALTGAATGERFDVCVRGICEANVDGATVAGSPLGVGATAGQAAVVTVGAIAFALEADVSNVATVYVR